jgi:hypothetical protein
VAGVLGGQIFIFVVDLGVISFEVSIFILIIFISIWSRNNNIVNLMRVKRDLKVDIELLPILLVHGGWDTCDADIDL